MRTKALCLVLFVGMFAICAASEDDFLRSQREALSIRSETVLSDVGIYQDTIEGVIAKFGKPDTVVLRQSAEPSVVWRTYEWQRKNCRIWIVTLEGDGRSLISSIEEWGTGPDAELGTTGRGLKLGDSLRDARRIYGLDVHLGVTLSEKGPFLSSTGCSLMPQPTLGVDFDETGRINHMRMSQMTFCY